jgi:sucrose phosphorylase
VRNQVQLITYVDRLAGTLPGLRRMLAGPLAGLFGGVHLLPFFTPFDGADAGFDPADHAAVDPRLGTWDDVAALSGDLDTVVDLIVNHVSAQSPAFLDVVARGDASPSAGMFLTFSSVFPEGATEADLLRIYRPRPGLPFTAIRLGGASKLVWTTFTDKQIDVDVRHRLARRYLTEILETLAAAKVRLVRVDAVGYVVKTPGTSSFMTPETFAFIDELTAQAKSLGLDVLVEVHSHYRRQIEIAAQVDRVYDFGLPPLVLYALHFGDVEPLLHWLAVRPANCVTVLDTHDGIGVIDVGADGTDPADASSERTADRSGLLGPVQLDRLVEAVHDASGGTSRRATGAAASNLDLYQVNCTFFDAVGRDDDRYLLARLIQFMAPGVPQVYYVGLLAGRNDLALLAATGVGRDVNRHHYTPDEVVSALNQPVVRRLCEVIRLRNAHPAFDGTFSFGGGGDRLWMRWDRGDDWVLLEAQPRDGRSGSARFRLNWTGADGVQSATHGGQEPQSKQSTTVSAQQSPSGPA